MLEHLTGLSDLTIALVSLAVLALTGAKLAPKILEAVTRERSTGNGNGNGLSMAKTTAVALTNRTAIQDLQGEMREVKKELVILARSMITREDVESLEKQIKETSRISTQTQSAVESLRASYELDVGTTMRKILALFQQGMMRGKTPAEGLELEASKEEERG